jgi:hypothetical protein
MVIATNNAAENEIIDGNFLLCRRFFWHYLLYSIDSSKSFAPSLYLINMNSIIIIMMIILYLVARSCIYRGTL